MSLIVPPEGSSDWPYVIQMDRRAGPLGLPLLKSPYRRIAAIDLNTGELLAQVMVQQRLHGPMSYFYQDRQYIAVAGGGRDDDAELIVFALP